MKLDCPWPTHPRFSIFLTTLMVSGQVTTREKLMPKKDIQLGQRFRSYTGSIWEVLRIPELKIAPKHVVIVDVNDRTASKMVSESALLESDFFQPDRKTITG